MQLSWRHKHCVGSRGLARTLGSGVPRRQEVLPPGERPSPTKAWPQAGRARNAMPNADPELRGHYVRVTPPAPTSSPPSPATPTASRYGSPSVTPTSLPSTRRATGRARRSGASRRVSRPSSRRWSSPTPSRPWPRTGSSDMRRQGLRTRDEIERRLGSTCSRTGASASSNHQAQRRHPPARPCRR